MIKNINIVSLLNWFKILFIENEGMAWGTKIPGQYGKLILTVFRIVQEALNNIVKHAQASSAKVRIEFAAAGVTVLVEDDGKGFEMTEGELPSGHYGIMGMRERMQLLNGKLSIKSAPRRGTRVMISVPL